VQLQEMLADAKTGFDVMIQACRDDFAAHVETEKAEATGRMDALNAEML
jgi:protoporphyrinogen oxidase